MELGTLSGAQWWGPKLDMLLKEREIQIPDGLPAMMLHGRKHLAFGEYPAARGWLERAIAQHPREIWPRVVYSRVLLQDGSDQAAVVRALRDVLAMEPNHAEARESLEVLLKDEGNH